MILTEGIKAKIEELYNITPDDVHGVSLGYKYKDGVNTGKIGLVFNVLKKQNINELKPSDVLPSIRTNGTYISTNIIEYSKDELKKYNNKLADYAETFPHMLDEFKKHYIRYSNFVSIYN